MMWTETNRQLLTSRGEGLITFPLGGVVRLAMMMKPHDASPVVF